MATGGAPRARAQDDGTSQHDAPRLALVARGAPEDPLTASGIARHLLDALRRRYPIAATVDCSLTRGQRALALAAAVHPDRAAWRERFYRHPLAWRMQSRNASRGLPAPEGYDVAVQVFVLFQTMPAGGRPVVLDLDTTHELSRRCWPAWSPYDATAVRRIYARERAAYHAAAHLFVRTREVEASLTGHYGVDPARVTVAGGGVPFDPLPAADAQRPRDPVVLFVGREWERKGGDRLLEAFARVRAVRPDARLVVVGTSEPTAAPGVEVLGRLDDRDRLHALYARATALALPARYDPYPGVLMEAMAHATPVVAADQGGIADIVDDGRAGVLVAPQDTDGLAGALLRLLDDPAERARLGAAGRARVERSLTWDAVVDRWAPVIDGLARR